MKFEPTKDDDPLNDPIPEWANIDAPGICGRGHTTRHPLCPACHFMRIDVYEAAKKASAITELKERRANPPKQIDNSSLYAGSMMFYDVLLL